MKSLQQVINEKLKLSDIKLDNYFYHEALEDGYTTKFIKTENILQYSIDNCQTWNDLKPNTETPEINKYERIYFKGENMKIETDGIGNFKSNKKFNAGGNVMSLIYGDDFKGKTKLLEEEQYLLRQSYINLVEHMIIAYKIYRLDKEIDIDLKDSCPKCNGSFHIDFIGNTHYNFLFKKL